MTRKKFKKTFSTDKLSRKASMSRISRNTYITYDDINKNAFSKQKLKYGEIGEINLKKGSKIFTITDEAEYTPVTGKSLDNIQLDEASSPQRNLKDIIFWVARAKICIILGDYVSALDRINRALEAFNWLEISLVYEK